MKKWLSKYSVRQRIWAIIITIVVSFIATILVSNNPEQTAKAIAKVVGAIGLTAVAIVFLYIVTAYIIETIEDFRW